MPARFRRVRVLIVGCGDVGMRTVPLQRGVRRFALTSTPARVLELRAAGVTPLLGDLDQAASLRRLAGLAQRVIHLAPPPPTSAAGRDPRTRALALALRRPKRGARGAVPLRGLVYGSTTGVYGDCAGAWVAETRPCQPTTERARRRVDAEATLRRFGREHGTSVSVLRIPGIYAPERNQAAMAARLLRAQPVLCAADDVFTNHIHADDLARAVVAALWRGRPQRLYNICDHSALRMGDYYDLVADALGLPRPPRIRRAEAAAQFSAVQLSFMAESRRLLNQRMRHELRLHLHHMDVQAGWATAKT